MHPVLVDLGWFEIRSYGFMLAISFLAGIYLAGYRAKRAGVKPQLILDLSVYIILASVIGSRLLYVLFHLNEYSNPLEVFALWQGGATFYGGLILAVLVSYVFIKHKSLSFLVVADVVAPSLALGVAFTRVGCFLSGCCYGKPTTCALGVHFPPASAAGHSAAAAAQQLGLPSVGLQPTQLYSSGYGFLILAVLLLTDKYLRHKRGAVFGLFLVLYGVARFVVDFFRYYEENAKGLFSLTVSQYISAALFIAGFVLLLRRTKPESGTRKE